MFNSKNRLENISSCLQNSLERHEGVSLFVNALIMRLKIRGSRAVLRLKKIRDRGKAGVS